jgi:N-acetylneuraminic acid mutarotase
MSKALFGAYALCAMLCGALPLTAQMQGAWTNTGSSKNTRGLNAEVMLGDGALLAGGSTDGVTFLATAEVFSFAKGGWKYTGSMAAARGLFPAVVLRSGKVLVAGGLGAFATISGPAVIVSGAELYDPAAGTWSPAGTLSVARFYHTATLLQNGKVLVAGGCTATDCSTLAAASELYDPATNSWSTAGSLNTARWGQTAALLETGKVLVVGGESGATVATCELYDPVAGPSRSQRYRAAAQRKGARHRRRLRQFLRLHIGGDL